MNKQPLPNFTKLWKEIFSESNGPVAVDIRNDANFFHDIIFLSSLLHDARLKNPYGKICDTTLTLEFNRDCWERGYSHHQAINELQIADCKLNLGGVMGLNLIGIDSGVSEPWLDYLWVNEDYRHHDKNTFTLSLVGAEWRMDIGMSSDEWQIRFADTQEPYLASKLRPNRQAD